MTRYGLVTAIILLSSAVTASAGCSGFALPRLDFPDPPVATTQGTSSPVEITDQ